MPVYPQNRSLSTIFLGCIISMCAIWASSTNVRGIDSTFKKDIWSKSLQTPNDSTINFAMSLVWSGQKITKHNLEALQKFREDFKGIRIVHFISPAYFTRSAEISQKNAYQINSVLKEGDRIGILLSGWRSYTLESDVIFRNGPSFWGSNIDEHHCLMDCGSDIPVHIYPSDDLDKLLVTGKRLLAENGFASPIAIKTNGFVSNQSVMESAVKSKIYMDFSAVSPSTIENKLKYYPLYSWISNLWKEIELSTAPFAKSIADQAITIVPQSLGAIDYHTPNKVKAIYSSYLESVEQSNRPTTSRPNHTFSMTLYQSTAYRNLSNTTASIQAIFEISGQKQINLKSLELPGNTFSDRDLAAKISATSGDSEEQPAALPQPLNNEIQEKLEIRTH